ncbi:hypothetical protein, partial [Allorhodopirellula solitaria]|uniref:hypothetical protein n=1 Tax=Allorhodopirellula solitaria TaxID=2527987 RepID=UPI001C97C8DB
AKKSGAKCFSKFRTNSANTPKSPPNPYSLNSAKNATSKRPVTDELGCVLRIHRHRATHDPVRSANQKMEAMRSETSPYHASIEAVESLTVCRHVRLMEFQKRYRGLNCYPPTALVRVRSVSVTRVPFKRSMPLQKTFKLKANVLMRSNRHCCTRLPTIR